MDEQDNLNLELFKAFELLKAALPGINEYLQKVGGSGAIGLGAAEDDRVFDPASGADEVEAGGVDLPAAEAEER